ISPYTTLFRSYQHLYNILIEDKEGSSYSLINQVAWFTYKVHIFTGTGQNYGLEFPWKDILLITNTFWQHPLFTIPNTEQWIESSETRCSTETTPAIFYW